METNENVEYLDDPVYVFQCLLCFEKFEAEPEFEAKLAAHYYGIHFVQQEEAPVKKAKNMQQRVKLEIKTLKNSSILPVEILTKVKSENMDMEFLYLEEDKTHLLPQQRKNPDVEYFEKFSAEETIIKPDLEDNINHLETKNEDILDISAFSKKKKEEKKTERTSAIFVKL